MLGAQSYKPLQQVANQVVIIIVNNSAVFGGGISLVVYYAFTQSLSHSFFEVMKFVGNNAMYRGAVYVNDDTYTATCDRVGVECFLQVLLLSDFLFYDNIIDCGYLVAFEHNYAEAKAAGAGQDGQAKTGPLFQHLVW